MQNNKGLDEEKVEREEKESARMVENSEREKEIDGDVASSRWDDWSRRAKHFASNKYNVIIVLLCILLLIFFLVVIGLAARLGSVRCPEPSECRTGECLSASAQIVKKIDYGSNPCQDFWAYSCRGWLQRNPLPDNKGSHSIIDELKTTIYSRIRHLIDLVPHDADSSSPQLKVKNFYKSCMSLGSIEYWAPDKLLRTIHELGGWALLGTPPGADWQRNDVIMKLQVRQGVEVFFRLTVEPDDRNPTKNIIKLMPDGLGMPNRDYYFRPQDDPYVKAYKQAIKNLLQEMDVSLHNANRAADDIFHYERRLAEITPDPEAMRDTASSYTVIKVRELDRLSSSISWTELLQAFFPGVVTSETRVGVFSEKYFADVSRLISSTDNGILNDYFVWRLIFTYAPHMSLKHQLVYNHYRQAFEGVQGFKLQNEDRWEFCLRVMSQYLGHAMGAMYIDKYFHQQDHADAEVYVQRLISSLSSRTHHLSWLRDTPSFKSAEEKVHSMILLLGYPSFAKSRNLTAYYKELKVQADYYQNMKDGVYFIHRKHEEMLKASTLHDYSWTIFPHSVEADYKYAGNELLVPAGLLELSLFDIGTPLAIKYGVLAAHVSNKLSEIFDLKGVNYEAYGVLKPWLSNSSMEAYQEKAECLQKILSNYSLHDVPVNSKLCLNNFIADVGGVKLAYEAYTKHSKDAQDIGSLPGMNMNNEQLFFVSYAQSLCEAVRPEKLMATNDASESLPGALRVLGTLQQLPEFASAFSCQRNDRMVSGNLCGMW